MDARARRLRARRPHGRRGGLRPARAAHGPRLPAGDVHLAAHQPAQPTATAASLANRLRFPLEVFDAVRAAWPAAKPISVRISATDWAEGGLAPDDAVEVARALTARTAATSSTCRPGRPCPISARLRPPVPDAVQRAHPPRGGHPHDGGRRHLLLRRRQHHPRRRPRRPLRRSPAPTSTTRTGPATPPASRASSSRGPTSTSREELHPASALRPRARARRAQGPAWPGPGERSARTRRF